MYLARVSKSGSWRAIQVKGQRTRARTQTLWVGQAVRVRSRELVSRRNITFLELLEIYDDGCPYGGVCAH